MHSMFYAYHFVERASTRFLTPRSLPLSGPLYRYRKLSTLVHPDKRLDMPQARDAFEEVKKAYQVHDECSSPLSVAKMKGVVVFHVLKEVMVSGSEATATAALTRVAAP